MNVLAIIQARLSSKRLPGKVLKTILSKPILELQLERVKLANQIDHIVVATSTSQDDDDIKRFCDRIYIPCFRGNLNNVLDRYFQASLLFRPKNIVRITADCPLIDPEIIDKIISFYFSGDFDYVSNALTPTFPDGLDLEVFSFRVLEEAWNEAKLPSELEHVTPFIWKQREKYRVGEFKNNEDLSHMRWTVDEPEDFELVTKIYESLYLNKPAFTMNDILDLIKNNPDWLKINQQFTRNDGFVKSLKEDEVFFEGKADPKLTNCLLLQDKAKKLIPGMTQLLSKRPDRFSMGIWPTYFKKAKGVEVWDLDDNRYIDMSMAGIGANILGYCDDDVNAAVLEAVNNGNSTTLNCPEEVELAQVLCDLHPWASKVRFARTGGESMAIAVRIARAYAGKDKVAFCGYHGWHDWYLAANLNTKDAIGEHLISGLDPDGVPKALAGTAYPFRYNDLKMLNRIIEQEGKEIGTIAMEPIRNVYPTQEFLEGVRSLANNIGAVLIVDEISSGFRINCGGAHLKLGIEPDVAVFSKALGNGYPIGAVIGKDDIMESAQATFISSTYWTERVGFSAALATIKKYQANNVSDHLMKIGELVQTGWKKAAEKHNLPIEVGGIFPLSHFIFNTKDTDKLKALFIQLMLEGGFLASTNFYCMYAHKEGHIETYMSSVNKAFCQISNAIKKGEVDTLLKGLPSVRGFERLN